MTLDKLNLDFITKAQTCFTAIFNALLNEKSLDALSENCPELTNADKYVEALLEYVSRREHGLESIEKTIKQGILTQFQYIRHRRYTTEKAIVWLLRYGAVVVFKTPEPSGTHIGVVVDIKGAEEFGGVIRQLQPDVLDYRPIEQRVKILSTTDTDWNLSTGYQLYTSIGGDEAFVKELQKMSYNQLGYLVSGDSEGYREYRAVIKFWTGKHHSNAVKDFF